MLKESDRKRNNKHAGIDLSMKDEIPFFNDIIDKQLFSSEVLAIELFTKFGPVNVVKYFDFNTIELYKTNFLSPAFKELRTDVVWRVKWKDKEWVYCFIINEFQSRPNKFMALRILVYSALLWWHLAQENKNVKNYKLPPIFPLVLYNGKYTWNAKCDLRDLLEKDIPDGLLSYQANQKYFLIDIMRLSDEDLQNEENRETLTATFFRLERTKDWSTFDNLVLKKVMSLLDNPKYEQFTNSIYTYLLKKLSDNPDDNNIDELFSEIKTKKEKDKMFADAVITLKNQLRQEGKIEGIAIGKAEGRTEGRIEGRAEGRIEGRAEGRIEGRVEEREESIRKTISLCHKLGISNKQIISGLGEEYGLSPEDAALKISQYLQ